MTPTELAQKIVDLVEASGVDDYTAKTAHSLALELLFYNQVKRDEAALRAS